MNMTCNAYLPAEHAPFSYLGRTCYTYLRRHYGVGAYFIIVCHLNQIIQFHAAMYDGGSHSSTVHTRVGTDFHMVFQDSDTYLRYFFIALGSGGEAETVCTDNATGVQDAVVSYPAIVVDGGVSVNNTVIAHFGTAANRDVRMNDRIVSHLCVFANAGKRRNVNILANFSCLGNKGQRVNSHPLWLALLIKI